MRGTGVEYIEKMKIFDFIEDHSDQKKEIGHKFGALYTLMALLENFGRLLEPYSVKII